MKLVLNQDSSRILLYNEKEEKQILDVPVNEDLMILKSSPTSVFILYGTITHMFKSFKDLELFIIQDKEATHDGPITDPDDLYDLLVSFRDE